LAANAGTAATKEVTTHATTPAVPRLRRRLAILGREAPASGPEPRGQGTALRHRNFALLWSGQTVSITGNGMFTVALPLEVLRLTNSSLDLALVVISRTIPAVILLLIGGTSVDRLSRRLVMLISDTVCGVAVSLTALLVAVGNARLWELFLLSITFGASSAFFKPAATAIVRDVLPPELFVSASSLSSLSQSMSQYLLGPLVGGIIVAAVGTGWAFGIDGVSFAVSAICLAAMRNIAEVKAARSRCLAGVMEGLRYCYSQRWLWWSMIAVGIANLACFVPFVILEPLLVRNAFHAGPIALGVMYAASGAGGALASLLAAHRRNPARRVTTIWTAWAAAGLCAAAIGLSPWLWMSFVFAGMTWGLATYGNIIWLPLIQRETPADLLGRVSSVDWLFSLALSPLGTIACGAAVVAVGVRLTLIAGGAICAATGAVLLIPGVRDPDTGVGAGSVGQSCCT
jgi:MFS family permease